MIINNKSLTYCSNIFKECNFTKLAIKLHDYSVYLRKYFKCKYIGLGLCMSNSLINRLSLNSQLIYLKKWINKHNFYLSSLNSFVYKSFHTRNIKEFIYYPDWTVDARVVYTKKNIYFLNNVITKIKNVSISTLPLSFNSWMINKNKKYVYFKTSINILTIVNLLINIYKLNKNYIHLDIEPEPRCLLESFDDFLFFFIKWLVPNANYYLNRFYIKKKHTYLRKYVNLCYDICHFSVNYNDHVNIIKSILSNKIKIGKVQVSSALEVSVTDNNKNFIINDLFFLNKSKFLHQNTIITHNKIIKNLDIDFNNCYNNGDKLRFHCHMPLYLTKYKKNLQTTSSESKDVLLNILKFVKVKHVEIETYTYDILEKKGKFESMLQEYLFVINIIKMS